jgi:hypothetical protein
VWASVSSIELGGSLQSISAPSFLSGCYQVLFKRIWMPEQVYTGCQVIGIDREILVHCVEYWRYLSLSRHAFRQSDHRKSLVFLNFLLSFDFEAKVCPYSPLCSSFSLRPRRATGSLSFQ